MGAAKEAATATIDEKYQALGGENGFLGEPEGPEQSAPDNVGRYRHYKGGSIYWHPSTDAHEVHGLIRGRWAELGWEQSELGYPTSDEMDTTHKFARISQFQNGSIFWHKDGKQPAYEVLNRPLFPASNPEQTGSWEIAPYTSGAMGLHAALLHTNQVLFLGYAEPTDPTHLVPSDSGDSSVLSLSDGNVKTTKYVGDATHIDFPNIFCGGHAFLPDGRLLMAGGDRENDHRLHSLHTFTPDGDGGKWQLVGRFDSGRFYPGCATLPDGRVFTVLGRQQPQGPWTDLLPTHSYQIFSPVTGELEPEEKAPVLQQLDAAEYPFLFVLPNHRLLIHCGSKTVFLNLDTGGFEDIVLAAVHRPDWNIRTYGKEGTCVLLPLLPPKYESRVMMIGGSGGPEPVDIRTDATKSCEILKLSGDPTSWKWKPAKPMSRTRVMPDAVLLPDGSVLVMNGSSRGYADMGANPVWEAEIYHPRTNKWTEAAPMMVPRLYHATALLLPDGRIMTSGTDVLWNPEPFHETELRLEIFSPPYLFKGGRPTVASAPGNIVYGLSFVVETPDASTIDSVALLRCGSCTHSFNSDQRYVGLPIVDRSSNALTLEGPRDPYVAPPGYYMLFLVRDGVPSEAPFVRVRSLERFYDAVWRPSTEGELQVYGFGYDDFRAKYDQLWDQGWRLHILNTYIENNQRLYDAVWRPSTEGELQVYGFGYDDFRAKYDQLWGQGWRLHILNTYIENNQRLYDAVWRQTGGGELQVYGFFHSDFRAKYDQLWDQGWRLHLLTPHGT